jgi:DNA-directed RNA polymerase specialized sigma24 family protein
MGDPQGAVEALLAAIQALPAGQREALLRRLAGELGAAE